MLENSPVFNTRLGCSIVVKLARAFASYFRHSSIQRLFLWRLLTALMRLLYSGPTLSHSLLTPSPASSTLEHCFTSLIVILDDDNTRGFCFSTRSCFPAAPSCIIPKGVPSECASHKYPLHWLAGSLIAPNPPELKLEVLFFSKYKLLNIIPNLLFKQISRLYRTWSFNSSKRVVMHPHLYVWRERNMFWFSFTFSHTFDCKTNPTGITRLKRLEPTGGSGPSK